MLKPNPHYADLKDSYLFYNIAQKTKAYCDAHPGTRLLRLGIYSHLQACGLINDHASDCPCFSRINENHPTVNLQPDGEVMG